MSGWKWIGDEGVGGGSSLNSQVYSRIGGLWKAEQFILLPAASRNFCKVSLFTYDSVAREYNMAAIFLPLGNYSRHIFCVLLACKNIRNTFLRARVDAFFTQPPIVSSLSFSNDSLLKKMAKKWRKFFHYRRFRGVFRVFPF